MTSEELIFILERLPPETLVELYDWNECCAGSTSFEEKDTSYDGNTLTLGLFTDNL